jgi:hypothetical protein
MANPSHHTSLIDNPAFGHALKLYGELSALGPATYNVTDKCTSTTHPAELFGKGLCLMTFGHQVFKVGVRQGLEFRMFGMGACS